MSNTVNQSRDLPPSREGKATAKHKTSLPGYKVPFNKFIYVLSLLVLGYAFFSIYRILQWKTMAGGWTSLLLGKLSESPKGRPGAADKSGSNANTGHDQPRQSVELQIQELARALGLPSRDLAAAIAEAVREHLPPASLSSVSAAEATQSGDAVNVLVGKDEDEESAATKLKENLGMLSSFNDPVELGALD